MHDDTGERTSVRRSCWVEGTNEVESRLWGVAARTTHRTRSLRGAPRRRGRTCPLHPAALGARDLPAPRTGTYGASGSTGGYPGAAGIRLPANRQTPIRATPAPGGRQGQGDGLAFPAPADHGRPVAGAAGAPRSSRARARPETATVFRSGEPLGEGRADASRRAVAGPVRALDARPEERAALTSGHLFSKASADSSNSLLAFELQQAALIGRTLVGEDFPGDLCFLAHEADLWPYAIKDHAMRGLLLRAYEMHADWLLRQARDGEGGRYAVRALELVEPGRERPNPHWFGAVWKAANHTARRRGHRAAANLIHSWTRVTDDPGFLSWLYRDQAVHTAAGHMGAALSLIVQARELADRSEHFETQHCGQYVHAQLLLAAGRPADALSVLPQPRSAQDDALMSAKNLLLWAQVMHALGERGDANDWLGRFYERVEQFNFDHLRPEGDALARRL